MQGLVYAEVSHLSFSQQIKSINLVDMEDPIEYAQISNKALDDEVSKMRNKQTPKENDIIGMVSHASVNILMSCKLLSGRY